MTLSQAILRFIGSLWLAAVLLVLLMVAMGSATVYESLHGTDQALQTFYKATWFKMLLAMVAINALVSMVLRFPFSKRQIGFVLTHAGILVTLAGAMVTQNFGIDGQVGIVEGQTVNDFTVFQDALTVVNRHDQTHSSVTLAQHAFGGFEVVDNPGTPSLALGDLRVEVKRFLPDSDMSQEVVDDSEHGRPAVEVSLSPSGQDNPTWLFVNRSDTLSGVSAKFRIISDEEEWRRLLEEEPAAPPASKGSVKVEYGGETFEIPLEDCLKEAVAVGETGYTVRVLRYLPHANVGADNQIISLSDRPINPAIEAEITGPHGKEKRLAFAKFPDFNAMHARKDRSSIEITFVAPTDTSPSTPVEVLIGPGGELYARFRPDSATLVRQELNIHEAVDTPWPGQKFTVLRQSDHAKITSKLVPVDPIRETPMPAILLTFSTADHTREIWLQKHRSRRVKINDKSYDVSYSNKAIPLNFELTLNRFRVGRYPGEQRPRSFESHITIVDSASGRNLDRVISMNNPTTFGGFTLYQSSYRQDGGKSTSILSVSKDPGQIIVFAGYITLIIGMVWVLGMRMREQRRIA